MNNVTYESSRICISSVLVIDNDMSNVVILIAIYVVVVIVIIIITFIIIVIIIIIIADSPSMFTLAPRSVPAHPLLF